MTGVFGRWRYFQPTTGTCTGNCIRQASSRRIVYNAASSPKLCAPRFAVKAQLAVPQVGLGGFASSSLCTGALHYVGTGTKPIRLRLLLQAETQRDPSAAARHDDSDDTTHACTSSTSSSARAVGVVRRRTWQQQEPLPVPAYVLSREPDLSESVGEDDSRFDRRS